MAPRAVRLFALFAALLLSAACADTGSYTASTSQEPTRNESNFQSLIAAANIPLALPAGRVILVNIPSYELIAFEDGTPVLRSRVIVGTPEDRTPRLDTYTSQVLLRPSWQPTPEMIRSGEVSPGVRGPGEDNPMGLAAIRLAPNLLVYLHDTNQRYLFDRPRRAFSHGCIRVERWDELIAWLLNQDVEWVREMAATEPGKAYQAPAVPVLLRYYRTFPSEDGRVLRHPDVYGLGGA